MARNRFYLELDPFPIGSVDACFVSTPALRDRVDRILRAVHEGARPICVAAPRGAGKTALLEQVLGDLGPQWQVLRVSGASGLDRASFLDAIGGALDLGRIREDETVEAILVRLEALLDTTAYRDRTALVAIDDADCQSARARADLDALLARRQSSRVRFIAAREAAPEDPSGEDASVMPIDIPPLTRAESDDYVHTRLCAAGLRGDSPLSDEMLRSIHNASGGRPGRIHEVAARMLAKRRGTGRRKAGADTPRRRGPWSRLAAALGLPERPERA